MLPQWWSGRQPRYVIAAAALVMFVILGLAAYVAPDSSLSTVTTVSESLAASLSYLNLAAPAAATADAAPRPAAEADGCYHVYVDIGTNTGVQIHKLYNASIFPKAPILPRFEQYFGPGDHADVCAFGFEPNKNHSATLARAQAYYRALGRRVTYYNAAAGVADGWGIFTSDKAFLDFEWGGQVRVGKPEASPPPGPDTVPIIDIPRWIDENIVKRQPPPAVNASRPPALVMKIDIEGTDELVIAGVFSRAQLCMFDYVYYEHVRPEITSFLTNYLKAAKCKTVLERLDDESWHRYVFTG